MTWPRLLVRNLIYHWRGNVAVLLGVAVGSAVLTGALLVGDCLRGSLRALTLDQLAWVDQALVAGRFFRADVAKGLPAQRVSPAILLQGTATRRRTMAAKELVRSAGKVTVLGVDARFWPGDSAQDAHFWQSNAPHAVINQALAQALDVRVGDEISLQLRKADNIPRESLLGKRKKEDVLQAMNVKIQEIVPDKGLGRFNLKPGPEPTRNVFVPLAFLQEQLQVPGRTNALLAGGAASQLQEHLARNLTLDDWGLILHTPEDRARIFVRYLDPRFRGGSLKRARWQGHVPDALAKMADAQGALAEVQVIAYYNREHAYLSLESRQIYLEPVVVKAISEIFSPSNATAPLTGYDWAGTLVYLADSISDGKNDVPYAVVAALDTHKPAPLGPFQPPGTAPLAYNEITLTRWPGSVLQAKPGDPISIRYFLADEQGGVQEKKTDFVVRYVISLQGVADDADLTPTFPGITEKLNMASWDNPPFPYNPRRIKQTDEDYWKRYRATPRAFVSLQTGQRLWGSRFGQLTSIRIAPPVGSDFVEAAQRIRKSLLHRLTPEEGGMVFQDVKEQGLRSGAGSTDFSQLFVYFSFFLIAAALLLVGLLFRLNLDRRASEIGLFLAMGIRRQSVYWLLLGEGSILAILGGFVGLVGAVGYAHFLLEFFRENWPGTNLAFLEYHGQTASYIIGYAAALSVSLLTIVWATRLLAGVSPKDLLAGATAAVAKMTIGGRPRWSQRVIFIAAAGVILCLAASFFVTSHEGQAGCFFGVGAMTLIALLALAWSRMHADYRQTIFMGALALTRLGARNAARHPVRSILTMGLFASATFLVVAVQSFHRQTGRDFYDKHSGSGGFRLLAESDVPVFQDLNTTQGRNDFFAGEVPRSLEGSTFYPFRVRAGDDTSCLNLYRPLQPRILGVPYKLIQEGRFRFDSGLWQTPEEKANPWLMLERAEEDAVPAFADANTARWILHVGLGETIKVQDDHGNQRSLRIVGLLQESIFQGELLLADRYFRKLFPRQEGFGFFLVECRPDECEEVKSAMDAASVFAQPTAQRLESYLAVENTYLATFQALGGFGLLLGALGLAVVLLRNVWERRGELALLRALGFRRRLLSWVVLAESGYLLGLGLAVGSLSAALAVAPHLAGMQVLWLRLAGLLVLVLVVGLGTAALAVGLTLRAPLLTALRRE
jgi:putative ABC transport system permease protein